MRSPRIAVALLLALGCSQESPRQESPRQLPYGTVEAKISWPILCHIKAERASVTDHPDTTLVTIRTAAGMSFMFSAPTWQMDLAEKKCAEHARKPSRIIGQ